MINSIRGFLFYIGFSLVLIPTVLVYLLTFAFSENLRWSLARWYSKTVMQILRLTCGVTWEVTGMENLPPASEPLVILSKHQSAWETLWLFSALPNRVSFVYKKELHKVPVFGQVLATLGMIAIDRGKGGQAYRSFMKKGRRFLAKGGWVALFPEGTRTEPGADTVYKSGGVRFAIANEVPVLPIALNSGEVWPRNSIAKKPGVVKVHIGPVIQTKDREFAQVQEEVVNWIETEMTKISPQLYAHRLQQK